MINTILTYIYTKQYNTVYSYKIYHELRKKNNISSSNVLFQDLLLIFGLCYPINNFSSRSIRRYKSNNEYCHLKLNIYQNVWNHPQIFNEYSVKISKEKDIVY